MSLTKVTNKLGLVDNADEASIVGAITAIENRAATAETNLTEATAKLTDAETKLTEATNKVTDLQKQYDTLKAEKEAAELAAKTAAETAEELAIDEVINSFVKVGKIKNEAPVIAQWKVTAKAIGKDKAKEMLDALPVNKTSVKVEDKLARDANGIAQVYNAAAVMAGITAKNAAK